MLIIVTPLSNQDGIHVVLGAAQMRTQKYLVPCSTCHLKTDSGWEKGCLGPGLEEEHHLFRQWDI